MSLKLRTIGICFAKLSTGIVTGCSVKLFLFRVIFNDPLSIENSKIHLEAVATISMLFDNIVCCNDQLTSYGVSYYI
jgi:hypothetical protein